MARDAALLKTKIELELITNQEILTMIEKSKRGGLTFVGARRYAKANNKHMGEGIYDKKQESSYIAYVDANNLYGWAMVQPLPYKDIKFAYCPPTLGSSPSCRPTPGTIPEPDPETLRSRTVNPPTLETSCPETFRTSCPATLQTVCSATLRTSSETFLSRILETADDAETGYFCEVDLEFPPEIHELLKQMPPCPETLTPHIDWFSDYQREVMEKTGANTTSEKLIPHLMKHENYVLHSGVLKFVHNLGVKITLAQRDPN